MSSCTHTEGYRSFLLLDGTVKVANISVNLTRRLVKTRSAMIGKRVRTYEVVCVLGEVHLLRTRPRDFFGGLGDVNEQLARRG